MQSGFFIFLTLIMIRENLRLIQASIARAAEKSGRTPEEITLVAVTKTVPIAAIQETIRCGHNFFGENYIQEAAGKIPCCPPDTNWHFIGHLQSNKAKQAVKLFQVIETVDRWEIARILNKYARQLNRYPSILIQVNLGRERQKSGILSEHLEDLLHRIGQETALPVLGLMTMPPYFSDPEQSRPYFQQLKELSMQLARKNLFADNSNVVLSMGMSNDYTVAIEEGATTIRVGSALFGTRNI